MMLAINKDDYEQEVLKSSLPVVVEFWGEQCSVCLGMIPEVEALAAKNGDRVKFCKIPIAGNRRLCIDLKVLTVPTFLFYKNGELVGRIVDEEISIENLQAKVEAVAAQS